MRLFWEAELGLSQLRRVLMHASYVRGSRRKHNNAEYSLYDANMQLCTTRNMDAGINMHVLYTNQNMHYTNRWRFY